MKKTSSTTLQEHLDRWFEQATSALASMKLLDIVAFVETFAPLDVGREDRLAYARSLLEDKEFFEATVRDIGDCAGGTRVSKLKGDHRTSVEFTLLPPANVEAAIDIVRELAFTSLDNGITWRADG